MIKLNRIGYKLGLAGAVGVLLAIGLVANQLATEATVAAANDHTDRLQLVAESTLAAHLNMRQVQLSRPRHQAGEVASRNRQGRRRDAPVRRG